MLTERNTKHYWTILFHEILSFESVIIRMKNLDLKIISTTTKKISYILLPIYKHYFIYFTIKNKEIPGVFKFFFVR